MTLKARIELLSQLGEYFHSGDELLNAFIHRTAYNNGWLTIENYEKTIKHIAQSYLQKETLESWVANYQISENRDPKSIGIVMGGLTPLTGFYDVLSVFLSGNQSLIKLSETDKFVWPHLIKKMGEWNSVASTYFKITERLTKFDAIIAHGVNGQSNYFKQYFGKYPNILRKNKKGIAVLNGTESMADLYALGNDIFEFFGLGNRNVSKLYVPRGYNFEHLLEALHEYNSIILNNKYKNNFDYNYAMFLLNKVPYKANGCIILVENEAITSRIASLHYEFYDKPDTLVVEINRRWEEIQCVISKMNLAGIPTIPFGKGAQPELTDYLRGVDTMEFLLGL